VHDTVEVDPTPGAGVGRGVAPEAAQHERAAVVGVTARAFECEEARDVSVQLAE
jgi:hypothetical protein